jgi:hypothetical protein
MSAVATNTDLARGCALGHAHRCPQCSPPRSLGTFSTGWVVFETVGYEIARSGIGGCDDDHGPARSRRHRGDRRAVRRGNKKWRPVPRSNAFVDRWPEARPRSVADLADFGTATGRHRRCGRDHLRRRPDLVEGTLLRGNRGARPPAAVSRSDSAWPRRWPAWKPLVCGLRVAFRHGPRRQPRSRWRYGRARR